MMQIYICVINYYEKLKKNLIIKIYLKIKYLIKKILKNFK